MPLIGALSPLSPFVVANRVITPSSANGSRLPCRARLTAMEMQQPCLNLRSDHRPASAGCLLRPHSPSTAFHAQALLAPG